MAKRVTVTTELTTEELHERYRNAANAVERTHWHILWLIKDGHTPEEVAFMLGSTARWIRTIVQRWNRAGEQAIRDQRRLQKGAPSLLSLEQQKEVDQALDQPPADGGLWSAPKVATWMVQRLGREVDPRRGWDYLQRLGRSTLVPRPQHAESDQAAQQAFKNSPKRLSNCARRISKPALKRGVRTSTALVSSRSCAGFGQSLGSRVQAVVRPSSQWMYLYGFVEPQSGKTSWLLMPTVNTADFSLALAAFAQERGAGPHKQILLVLDQASWHKSGDLVVPEGLHLLFLPSHSPELQPAERLWPLSNEPLANRVFCSLDELQDVQAARCRWLQAHPDVIRGRTTFHW